MTPKQKHYLSMIMLLTIMPAGLLVLSLASATPVPSRYMVFLLMASLVGILSSFATSRVKRIMRFVPIKALLAASLAFVCLETLHQKFHASIPISAADFYPLALIATYLFVRRFAKHLLVSYYLKSSSK